MNNNDNSILVAVAFILGIALSYVIVQDNKEEMCQTYIQQQEVEEETLTPRRFTF